MPHKDREAYNAYMAQYMLVRYHRRKAEMIEILGGTCTNCGAIEDLEIDHIDRATKSFEVTKFFSYKWERVVTELSKCHLLCTACHKKKTSSERSVQHGGGVSGKRNCKCAPCREAKNRYARDRRRARTTKADGTGF